MIGRLLLGCVRALASGVSAFTFSELGGTDGNGVLAKPAAVRSRGRGRGQGQVTQPRPRRAALEDMIRRFGLRLGTEGVHTYIVQQNGLDTLLLIVVQRHCGPWGFLGSPAFGEVGKHGALSPVHPEGQLCSVC